MITLSNLRKETYGENTRLVCDFKWRGGVNSPFQETTMWFAIKSENADFFSTRVYDPFVLVSYYIAMYYGEDLKICGNVSKMLYRNCTNYIQRIFRDFSDEMKRVAFSVDGFDETEKDGKLIGSGISCGVDSLSTIYDHYVKEIDPEYRINALFLFNCGTHGDYEDENSHKLFAARYEQNKKAALALGLPIYAVESNLHAFTHVIGNGEDQKIGYLAIWSCVLSLQRVLSKYYVASCFSYREIVANQLHTKNIDIDEFCGSYLVPLIQTEALRIIYDGVQRKRTEKTQNIAEWDIAQKHLNVCINAKNTAENCSCCSKCFRTLIALETLGKLESFSSVFDLEKYKNTRFHNLCIAIVSSKKEPFDADNITFAKAHHVKLPPKWIAYPYVGAYRMARFVVKHLLHENTYQKLKQKMDKQISKKNMETDHKM